MPEINALPPGRINCGEDAGIISLAPLTGATPPMAVHSFSGISRPSPWGYNWTEEIEEESRRTAERQQEQQMANLPSALLGSLKRDKKPFTYTPGGVDLAEVLNARLQKRVERKKRYQEEVEENKRRVLVAPTYNSPLHMYSMQNAVEALEVQAKLATGRSSTLPRNHTFRFEDEEEAGRGVAQSKAFRVLQIITDTEEERGVKEEGCFKPRSSSRFFPQKSSDEERHREEEPPADAAAAAAATRQQENLPVHQSLFGTAPKLKRPAAFLPPAFVTMRNPAAGTDF